MTSLQRVFFDIHIGSQAEHQVKQDEYQRAVEFLRLNGETYGLSGLVPEDLDDAGRETLTELYNGDPAVSSQGPLRLVDPGTLLAGRLVFELFKSSCPKTCDNFVALVTGSHGVMKAAPNKPLNYKGTRFHRVVKGWIAQAGDITRGDGSGGVSIWGDKFNDEKEGLKLKFGELGRDGKGVLAMANKGKNTNTSQFFITLSTDIARMKKTLDGNYVIFGQLVDGFDVLDKIDAVGTTEQPTQDIVIASCGLL